MSDPDRLLERGADDFERELLLSARHDVASSRALRRTLIGIGVGAALPLAVASTAKAAALAGSASSVAKLGVLSITQWVGIGVAVGVATLGGFHLAETAAEKPQAPAPAVLAPTKRAMRSEPSARPARTAVVDAPLGLEPPAASAPEPAGRQARRPEAEPAQNFSPPQASQAKAQRSIGRLAPEPGQPSTSGHTVAPSPARATPARAPRARSAAARLEQEVALLDRARKALKHGRAGEALTTLKDYESDFAGGGLMPEATVLKVRALLEAGDRDAAVAAAQGLLRAAPHGHHANLVRTLLARKHKE